MSAASAPNGRQWLASLAVALYSTSRALSNGGLFGPSAEEKQRAMLACSTSVPMPSCVDPASAEALPAWERFGVSPAAFACIDSLSCGDDVAADSDAVIFDCLVNDNDDSERPPNDDGEVLDCLENCLDNLEAYCGDDDDDLGAHIDEHEACRDRCF